MAHNNSSVAKGKSTGKLILIGEHAVVYGMPAIAMSFPKVKAVATVEKNDSELMFYSEVFKGQLTNIPSNLKGIKSCIIATLKALNKPLKGLLITVNSTIPTGRGLGSSAAVAIAIVKSLYSYFDQHLSKKQLMELVKIAEVFAHGDDSGLDTVACIADHPIFFKKGLQREKVLKIVTPFYIVVADTGINANTSEAVLRVRKKVQTPPSQAKDYIVELGMLTEQLFTVLQSERIHNAGPILTKAQQNLQRLGVSCDEINRLVTIACHEGALGAKLTGGGLGGCIIAIAEKESDAKTITNSLKQAGADHVWYFKVINNM